MATRAKGARAAELNAIAQRAGYPTYYQYRKAQAQAQGYTGYSEQRAARKAGTVLPSDEGKARQGKGGGGRKQVYRGPAGTVAKTTSGGRGWAVLEAQLRNARPASQVKVIATIRDDKGVRQVELFHRGGWSAGAVADAMDDEHDGSLVGLILEQIARQYPGRPTPEVLGAQVVVQAAPRRGRR